ncbi:MAG TPA: 2-phospho-L-lactate transferase CofD family protein [Solirubrobacteraceae bacterium]|nr:2-phospho-L-lactate transferase CofD family protein [Solirubrobacteraceae bacterium]
MSPSKGDLGCPPREGDGGGHPPPSGDVGHDPPPGDVGHDPPSGDVVVLAGGTGGAKLARGMLDVVGPERLAVIANTGDDIEIYGAHVSPDPDLVSFWLADLIDDRGWGLAGDTFNVMDGLRALGAEVWFNLGDRDLAWCMERARLTGVQVADARAGAARPAAPQAADAGSSPSERSLSPTAALARLNAAIGVEARVLPMSDEPVHTWIQSGGRWRPFQEFMIRERAAGPVEGVQLRGIERARPTPEVLAALAGARAIAIGPSNPLISIDPILAVPGMRDALCAAPAPIVAVSPIVGGEVLKGPTAAFMAHAGRELSAAGVVEHYGELLDGIVADEAVPGVPALRTDTRMGDADARAGLATRVLAFADSLRP